MKYLLNIAILIGLAAYVVAFYVTPLPEIPDETGQPIWRGELVKLLLLRPDDWLWPNWFGSPPQFSLGDRLPVLLVAGLILTWAAALGWLLMVLLRWVCGAGVSPAPIKQLWGAGVSPASVWAGETPAPQLQLTQLETFVFAVAVGLSALSTWVLLLGLFGVLERTRVFAAPAIVTVLAAAGVGYGRCQQIANHRRLAAAGLAPNGRGPTAPGAPHHREALPPGYSNHVLPRRWLWLAGPFVLAILLAAMLPPTDFDVCEYHLQAPKEFFQQGKIAFLPHNVYANMTLGTEMLSLLAMVIAGNWWWGALAGKTVIAAFTPLCALGLYAAGRRFYSTSAGVAAALVYISIPWVASTSIIPANVNVTASGLVEGASACYLFLAVYALLLTDRTWDRLPTCHLILAGYLAGAAAATKYPAVLFVLLPLAAWAFFKPLGANTSGQGAGFRGEDWKFASIRDSNLGPPTLKPILSAMAALTVFLLAAAVGCGLWFGKNWIQSGNPTYPLLYEVFDGKTWNADKDRQWNLIHRPNDFSAETLGEDLGRVVLTSEWLSPLVVPLAVLALVFPAGRLVYTSRRLAWGLLLYAVFVVAVWWLFTHRIDRFWIPVLPLLALLAGAGACWNSALWWRIVLKGLLLAGLGANFLVASAGPGNAWFVPLEKLRDDPRRAFNPWHLYFNHDSTTGGMLAVGDAAVFDLKRPVFYNTCFDDCIFEQWVKGKEVREIRAALASRNIAYVFVDWGEISRYRRTYGFTDFVQPEVFDELVNEGVLAPVPQHELIEKGVLTSVPPQPGYPEQVYRVLSARHKPAQSSSGKPAEDRIE